MSKFIISLVSDGGRDCKYYIDNSEYSGKSTVEAIAQYYLSKKETFKILLLKPESLDEQYSKELVDRLVNYGIERGNVITEEFPVNGYYNDKYYDVDNIVTADFIFLALHKHVEKGFKEIILDVSRGLNFLILLTVEAYRRFIVSKEAYSFSDYRSKSKMESQNLPKFYYIYLTPKDSFNYHIVFENAKAPFFVDYFQNYDKIPFNFGNNKELYKNFNFVKEDIIKHVNNCITTIKRGYALAFLTVIPWDKIRKSIDLSYKELTLDSFKNLLESLTVISEKRKTIKLKMNYPLGNLWIYINFLEFLYSIYEKYKDKIVVENNRKWVNIETLENFCENIIKEVFKENSAETILANELEYFKRKFNGKNDMYRKGNPSNYQRNFEAHAGLILEFLAEDPINYRVSYKFGEVLEKNSNKEVTEYINDFLKIWKK
ncbi:MAG: hypothetical protein CBR30_05425 [Dictyoglomus sp. NZ13-RE01]|nr:MAG: hypothetical protein CBR30_05425 [Dictyoglomus sp. NZ13-RE01]